MFQPFWAPDVHHKCCAEDLYGWRVIALAGHKALSTTQRYIEADVEAQKRVVACIGLWDPGGGRDVNGPRRSCTSPQSQT